MKFFNRILFILPFISTLYAEEPLLIAVDRFDPPFVMQSTNKEIIGFDIEMMNSLCQIIHRDCTYKLMKFKEIIPAVANNEVDLAISGITITLERSKIVYFTLPYLMSYSHFLTNRSNQLGEAFNLELLKGKSVGVQEGSVFKDQLKQLGVTNTKIVEFYKGESTISGLKNNDVDFLLLDNPTAIYWSTNASESFMLVGDRYGYGNGFGIAISPKRKALLNLLNRAILQYQSSDEYRINYKKYIDQL